MKIRDYNGYKRCVTGREIQYLCFLEDWIHIMLNQKKKKKKKECFNVSRCQDFRTYAGLVHNFAELLFDLEQSRFGLLGL